MQPNDPHPMDDEQESQYIQSESLDDYEDDDDEDDTEDEDEDDE